jgi:hypothetical protein
MGESEKNRGERRERVGRKKRRERNKIPSHWQTGPVCHRKVGTSKLGVLLKLGVKSTSPKN